MSKRHPKPPVDLQDYKDKLLAEKSTQIRAGDRLFSIRPVDLLSDADYKRLMAADDKDVEAQGRIMMGDEYDAFVEAGGSGMLINSIIQSQAEDAAAGEDGASSAS